MKSHKKCYVLMVAKTFPGKHPRRGEPTDFHQQIIDKVKLHTLRLNYPLWKHRIDQINAGLAYLSVRQWQGKPYHSGHTTMFETEAVGIQKALIYKGGCQVENEYIPIWKIAKNDGLSFDDFTAWFTPLPKEPCAMIHFTDFRY